MQAPNLNGTEVERLYIHLSPALVLFAVSITGDRARAQDAVHHVFLKMIENSNLGEVADVKAYLFTCVRNATLNERKTRQRNVALHEGVAWFDPPHRDYAAELKLRRALYLLPDDQREVVVLHVWGELTFLQIADVLNISSNTAASRYRYALTRLRESMFSQEDSCANPSR